MKINLHFCKLGIIVPLSIFFFFSPLWVSAQCNRKSDSLALVELYKNYGGSNWTTAYRWDLTKSIDNWKGIGLNAQGCVYCVDLDGDAFDCHAWSSNPPGIGIINGFPTPLCRLTALKRLHLAGNLGVRGTIPDSIRYLTQLEVLFLHYCSLFGPFPEGFGNLRSLIDFTINNNPLNTSLPPFLSNLKKLTAFGANSAQLYGAIPPEMGSMDSLKRLFLGDNKLIGTVPIALSARLLSALNIGNNLFDSLPKLNLKDYGFGDAGFIVLGNKLTFDDLLPILPTLTQRFYTVYAPQDSIFKDTTITARIGDPLSIDLKIDAGISNSNYKWLKNGVFYKDTNRNTLVFNRLQATDAGEYTCQVTNPNAPLLTLISRKITVVVNPALVDTTSCRYKDSLALVDLYRSYGGINWHLDYQWRFNRPMTEWKGVQLNRQGCVKCLDLDGDVNMCGSWSELPPGIGISSNTFPMPLCRLSSLELLLLRGNRELKGSLPDSIQYLANLKGLHLDQCSLSGPFPNGFRFLRNLGDFTIYDNRLNTFLPTFLKDLKKLGIFHASNCQLYDTIPSEIGEMDSLQIFNVNGNNLTGQIPNSFLNRTFHKFEIANNQFDSLPPLVMRDIVETLWWQRPTFLVQNNKFTFDDLLPILLQPQVVDSFYVVYAPQDSIFQTTTYTKRVGDPLSINLKIDGAITNSNYKWFKNGVFYKDTNRNTLTFNRIQATDAGEYTCQVTNPNARLLTLISRKITVVVNPALVDTTSCRYKDSIALAAFYRATKGQNWTIKL